MSLVPTHRLDGAPWRHQGGCRDLRLEQRAQADSVNFFTASPLPVSCPAWSIGLLLPAGAKGNRPTPPPPPTQIPRFLPQRREHASDGTEWVAGPCELKHQMKEWRPTRAGKTRDFCEQSPAHSAPPKRAAQCAPRMPPLPVHG